MDHMSMKKTIVMLLAIMLLPLTCLAGGKKQGKTFTVLQWNIWQEGTMVKGGYEAILNELERLRPDYVTFSEVRNYRDDFIARVCKDMAKRGVVYYGFRSDDTGLLSSTPITAHKTATQIADAFGFCQQYGRYDDADWYATQLDYSGYLGAGWLSCTLFLLLLASWCGLSLGGCLSADTAEPLVLVT